jgi:hypothetical protein
LGKRTLVLARFSTVAGEQGYADTDRDPRGFALKFYTEEGNYDLVGNNTPVFFVRDPTKFQDFLGPGGGCGSRGERGPHPLAIAGLLRGAGEPQVETASGFGLSGPRAGPGRVRRGE